MTLVAYDPNDREQRAFLSALSTGESGGGTGSPWLGGAKYSFAGSIKAALSGRYGLDFSREGDQDAGAYYLAQEVYAMQTGRSLDADLDAGQTSYLEGALRSLWPSVQGTQASPQGLAAAFSQQVFDGQNLGEQQFADAAEAAGGSPLGNMASFFQRFGLVIVGGIIVLVALWNLLANSSAVPSPAEVVRAAT